MLLFHENDDNLIIPLLFDTNSIKSKGKMTKVGPDEESADAGSSAFNLKGLKSDQGGIFYTYYGKSFQVSFFPTKGYK